MLTKNGRSHLSPEVGETYDDKITSLMPYGAFVEFMPDKEGLLHISEIGWKRYESVEDTGFHEGDKFAVKLVNIDPKTEKFKLSHKALLPKPAGYQVSLPLPPRGCDGRSGHDVRGHGDRSQSNGGSRGGGYSSSIKVAEGAISESNNLDISL